MHKLKDPGVCHTWKIIWNKREVPSFFRNHFVATFKEETKIIVRRTHVIIQMIILEFLLVIWSIQESVGVTQTRWGFCHKRRRQSKKDRWLMMRMSSRSRVTQDVCLIFYLSHPEVASRLGKNTSTDEHLPLSVMTKKLWHTCTHFETEQLKRGAWLYPRHQNRQTRKMQDDILLHWVYCITACR